jgi:hypothetical protein
MTAPVKKEANPQSPNLTKTPQGLYADAIAQCTEQKAGKKKK